LPSGSGEEVENLKNVNRETDRKRVQEESSGEQKKEGFNQTGGTFVISRSSELDV
jgi:hypothetical protein